jgi:hypothetical protein
MSTQSTQRTHPGMIVGACMESTSTRPYMISGSKYKAGHLSVQDETKAKATSTTRMAW